MDPRSSTNLKTKNTKKTKGPPLSNCLKPVINRKNLKAANETHYIQTNKDNVDSRFCIRSNAS